MSVDRTLKLKSTLERHRNVLSRGERILKMQAEGKWDKNEVGALGLPKVGNRKLRTGKKKPRGEGTEE